MSSVRVRLVVLCALAALLALPRWGAAQQQDQVVQRQLAYDAARTEHAAAVAAWRVREDQFNNALEAQTEARNAGDEQRRQNALRGALDIAPELARLERRVNELADTLQRARTALLDALGDRLEQLNARFDVAGASERAQLAALIRDLQNQVAVVEAESSGPALRTELEYSSIQYDGRDTPETLVAKAQLLREKAAKADSSIALVDREITRIERQLRSSRNVQSLVTGVERFGDAQPPVGAPNRRQPGGDVRPRADSTGVAGPEGTLEEQLQRRRLLRGQLVEAKRQFLDRANTFEQLARRAG